MEAGIPASRGDLERAAGVLLLDPTRVRARRITIIVLATAALGLMDLAFTLTYMNSVGMIEANPLARAMVAIGGAGQLIRFKLFTILLSGGSLYLARRRRITEAAAWIGLVIMLMLSAHWLNYNEQIELSDFASFAEVMAADTRYTLIQD